MTRKAGKFSFGGASDSGNTGGGLWLLLAAVIAILGLGAYWYFNPQAQPGFIAEYLPSDPKAEILLYRWKGPDGQWVVSDQLPPAGIEYEQVRYSSDANVIPSDKGDED